jgi:organic hydroperoxide reductase OsmC/OhrA
MAERVHVYEASVVWTGNRGQGTSSYTSFDRDHTVRGTGKPELPMSADPAFRGDPAKYNPEELLVASLSSCHMLWYLALCAKAKIIVKAYEDRPSGRLVEGKPGGGHFESVVLRPVVTIESGDIETARRLHHEAHRECFISNSVNFPVSCEPTLVQA